MRRLMIKSLGQPSWLIETIMASLTETTQNATGVR